MFTDGVYPGDSVAIQNTWLLCNLSSHKINKRLDHVFNWHQFKLIVYRDWSPFLPLILQFMVFKKRLQDLRWYIPNFLVGFSLSHILSLWAKRSNFPCASLTVFLFFLHLGQLSLFFYRSCIGS